MKPPPSLLLPEVCVVAKKTAPSGGKPRASVCNQSREGLIRKVPCGLCGLVTTEWLLLPGPVPEIPPCRLPGSDFKISQTPGPALHHSFPASLDPHPHRCFWSVLPSSHCSRCSLNKCWMSEQTVAKWALPPGRWEWQTRSPWPMMWERADYQMVWREDNPISNFIKR